mgnify:CR=1 FL=1
MTKKMDRKGQTALETAFVVLFIITAVWAISARTMRYTDNIGRISEARSLAQGIALSLSMRGTTTHLIRLDEAPDRTVDLYVMSEDCSGAQTASNTGMPRIINPAVGGWTCGQCLYLEDIPCTPGETASCQCYDSDQTARQATKTCLQNRCWACDCTC